MAWDCILCGCSRGSCADLDMPGSCSCVNRSILHLLTCKLVGEKTMHTSVSKCVCVCVSV